MRRQLTLLLFFAILLASLASALVVAVMAYQRLSVEYSAKIDNLHQQLRDRFRAFDFLLLDQERSLDQRMTERLPLAADDIERTGVALAEISGDVLSDIARRYDFDHLYLIDARGVVINSTLPADINLDLTGAGPAMSDMLERVRGSGQIFADRFNASIHDGRLNKYAYFGPSGEDHVVEASIELRTYLKTSASPEMDRFLFNDLFDLSRLGDHHILDFDAYIATDYGGWSLLNEGTPLPADVAEAFRDSSRRRLEIENNQQLTVYERLTRIDGDLGETDSLITEVRYDQSGRAELLLASLLSALSLGLGFALLAFLISRQVLSRSLIRPVATICHHLDQASLEHFHSLPETRVPELDRITRGINALFTRISEREAQLLQAQTELESRVRERTASLEVANLQLTALARTDPLTGLANRRAFFDSAARELTRARREQTSLTVVMLDLDNFKELNDAYGHAAGDTTLQLVSGIFRQELRDTDSVARMMGGEEFAMLLPGADTEQTLAIVERIREAIAGCPVVIGRVRFNITISGGIALCDSAQNSIDTALSQADHALYQAKKAGRNRIGIYSP